MREDAHGRSRAVSIRDDQARRLSGEESAEPMAVDAHPFFVVWRWVAHAAGDADVFPRRSAAGVRSDLSEYSGRVGTGAADFGVRLGDDDSGARARVQVRY